MVLGGMRAGTGAAFLQCDMQDGVLVIEMRLAHCEVIGDLGDQAVDAGFAARVRGPYRNEAAHVSCANAFVNGAVRIVSVLVCHQMLLAGI